MDDVISTCMWPYERIRTLGTSDMFPISDMVNLPQSVFSFTYRLPQVNEVISSYEEGRNCVFASATRLLTEADKADIDQFMQEMASLDWSALYNHTRRFLDGSSDMSSHIQLLSAYNSGLAYWESVRMGMIGDSAIRISIF